MPLAHRSAPAFAARLLPTMLAASLMLAFGTGGAHAETDAARMTELERKLEQAVNLVQQLNQRVKELEAKTAPAGPVAAAPTTEGTAATPALADKVAVLEQELAALSNRPEEDHGLAVHGFADVGFAGGSQGRPVGGYISSVDFYLTPKFGDRVKSLIEMNFEVGGGGSVDVDLERLQIGYTVSDQLTLWAGRFHTPYGYWNTAFHHGAQLQTAIRRPRFLEFEDSGGILPAHTVGLWGTGGMKTGVGKISYDLYAGNAPSIQLSDPSQPGSGTLDPGLLGAANRAASVGGNLSLALRGSLDGLTIGVHGLSSKVGDTATQPNTTRVQMAGGWATYLENNWEALAEVYRFSNRDLSGGSGSHSSQAGYVQLGYNVGAFTPYARFERTSLDQADNYFAQQESGQSYRRAMVGIRYDLNPTTALKLEANHTSLTDRATGGYSEFRSQVAVRF